MRFHEIFLKLSFLRKYPDISVKMKKKFTFDYLKVSDSILRRV